MRLRLLDYYIGSRFIMIYVANLLVFSMIYVLIDTISQYDHIMDQAANFGHFLKLWARFYGAQLPILFCRVLGGVTLAASAAFTVTLFQRNNEFTPPLAAGIDLRRLLAPILVLSLVITAGSALVQEFWVPWKREEIQDAKALGRGKNTLRATKFFDSKNQVLLVFRSYFRKERRAKGVLIFALPGFRGNRFLLEAESAEWVTEKGVEGSWIIRTGTIQEYHGDGSLVIQDPLEGETKPRLAKSFQEIPLDQLIPTRMLPQDLEARESQDNYLWFSELRDQTRRFPDNNRWRVRLFGRVTDLFHGLILVLLCIPTVLGRGTRNIFLSAIATVVLCGLYFVTYTFLINLANHRSISPGLAVGLAPLFFLSLGAVLYYRIRS